MSGAGPQGGGSSAADGMWHRMHPLTPVVRSWQVFAVVLFFLAQEFGQNAVQGWMPRGPRGPVPGRGSGSAAG